MPLGVDPRLVVIFMLYNSFKKVSHNSMKSVQYKINSTRMWANAQPDGRPAEHRWRPLFNTAKSG